MSHSIYPWGVLSFKTKDGNIFRCPQGERSYQNAISARLRDGDKIQSVQPDPDAPEIWNLGDAFEYVSEDGPYRGIITDFVHVLGEWCACDRFLKKPFLRSLVLIQTEDYYNSLKEAAEKYSESFYEAGLVKSSFLAGAQWAKNHK